MANLYLLFTVCKMLFTGLPYSSSDKESVGNAGDQGLIPGLGRSSGEEYGNPLQYSCLENFHGQRSLAGYSPWGRKESDTTERQTHKCCSQPFTSLLVCTITP